MCVCACVCACVCVCVSDPVREYRQAEADRLNKLTCVVRWDGGFVGGGVREQRTGGGGGSGGDPRQHEVS